MSKVHILPSDVISKIAAGEVIERPASVIKELIENSLDAGADSIAIHLKEAGKNLILVKDNGLGIEAEDLGKLFSRHATSKIEKADDLERIHSLGFRGEALYSIGAIADVNLRSKTEAQEHGWEIHVRGGEKINRNPVAMSRGTEIEVKELFFNTPARRKFLKSNTAEINQILNIFIPYTLLYHQHQFFLSHQDKDLVDLPPHENQLSRIAHSLNLEEKHLLSVQQNFQDKNIFIKMVLGDINIRRSRRDLQFIFINNRPVQNKNIAFHLNQVYRLILPPDVYPFFAIFIQMPANEIDVNIHPTKREVKIRDEHSLGSILRWMCQEALMKTGRAKEAVLPANAAVTEKALMNARTSEATFESSAPPDYAFPQAAHIVPRLSEVQEFFIHKSNISKQHKDNLQQKLANGRYIGSFINKFILFESNQSILVVDQHAAQERIAYEQFIVQMEKGAIEVQNLLSPVLIKLSLQEMLAWTDAKEKLEQIGLSSSQWDKETIAIHSQPQLLKEVEASVRELLAGENITHCDHDTIARRACRCSIMAGDKLSKEQAEYQRGQLIQCLDPFTCPHGRPTVVEITERFLDKQFLRT